MDCSLRRHQAALWQQLPPALMVGEATDQGERVIRKKRTLPELLMESPLGESCHDTSLRASTAWARSSLLNRRPTYSARVQSLESAAWYWMGRLVSNRTVSR